MEQDKNDRLAELFNQARNETPKINFKETQQQFLKATGSSASFSGGQIITKLVTVKSIIMGIVAIGVLAISGVLLFTDDDKLIEEGALIITEDIIVEEQITAIANLNDDEITLVETAEPHTKKITKETFVKSNLPHKKEVLSQKSITSKKVSKSTTKKNKDGFVFPVLTAKEIKANNKQILKMLKYLARWKKVSSFNNIDTRKYPMVYWRDAIVDGEKVGIDATDAFYMQNTEVSVLEYRTFLFDLLIQGRKADFLIAKPDQEQWVKAFKVNSNQPMVDSYFSHPAYNEYPINNISRKGAEMYCEWLTEERNKLNPEKYGFLANKVRLPTAKEWIQAASNRGKNKVYPWGNDEKGCDSCYFANYQPIKGNFIADGGFHTVKVNSYNANARMYCMSGNVAEMVTYEDGSVGALGGSWTSLPDEIKINAPDKYKGVSTPNVNIGFRPVILYLGTSNKGVDTNASKFCFPVLTYKEIKENNERKLKMFGKIKVPKKSKKKEPENIGKTGREQWHQPDPFGYLFIPMGNMNIENEEVSLQAFYMKQTEVSNIEYRTFLLDLLINNKRDEFLLAKPDQTVWNNAIGDSANAELSLNYFSAKKYDNNPVVGVSRKSAEMYCQWLNDEYEKRNVGVLINKFRIPTADEWMYAASGGGKRAPYPWGGPYIRNSKGVFLANFQPMKDDYIADQGLYTLPVTSYNPNDFGLYCMSGNVAEMVTYKDGSLGTKGGSWTSIGQELQIIEGEDRFEGVVEPNVNIGFRPVMTYLGRSKYKTTFTPPGTVEMDDSTYIDETEISNMMWLEYLNWQEKTYGKESEEFKKALPDTLVWRSVGYNKPLETHYLRHPAYGNYPVVGISYEQAIAYCKWRTARVKTLFDLSRKKNKKIFYHKNFEYRLPTKKEWEAGANAGYSNKTIKKIEGEYSKYINGNFKKKQEEHKKDVNSIDVTAPVQSYYPNKIGCYNLMGNVAEMLVEKGIAKGGSYLQTEKEVTVKKDFEYTKPERWLGFRCVYKVLK